MSRWESSTENVPRWAQKNMDLWESRNREAEQRHNAEDSGRMTPTEIYAGDIFGDEFNGFANTGASSENIIY